MKAVKLNSKTQNRIQVVLEDDFSFVLYKGEVRLYKIKEGEEVSQETIDTIVNEVLPKRAKLRAMNLLKVRPYTFKELREKLRSSDYPDSAVESAIEYVSSYGYLNDEQYAYDYVYTYHDRKSRMRIMQDLTAKGILKDTIIHALEEFSEEEGEDFELQQIKSLLVKKHYSDDLPYEEKLKILAYLCRKGYSVEKCKSVISVDFD